jgi:hypothetical protein
MASLEDPSQQKQHWPFDGELNDEITNDRALLHGFTDSYLTDDERVLDAEIASLEDPSQ